MRVVGGRCKGVRLASFRGRSIRPTSDKVREAVFNILANMLDLGSVGKVLDLFAGTGAMGIEALSRGAAGAVFVDSDQRAIGIIRKNLEASGLAASARVLKRDFKSAVGCLSASGETFGLVFIDPPYDSSLAPVALEGLLDSGVLAHGGLVVVETSRMSPLGTAIGYEVLDERRYGDTLVYLLTQAAPRGA